MNINYNTENWIKSLYKNEKLASHVSCAHGWKPFPQEKEGYIPPPLGLMSGVEAFSLAVKRAQRAQTAHLSIGARSTGWIQPFAPPLCLNASVKSWTLMFVKPFKDNNRQEQPANSLHLHCSVLMCTLQLILMSRGWLIFRRKANLYPEFAPAKTPHCVNELPELISNMTKFKIRTFCRTWLSGLRPSYNVHSPPVLQSSRQISVSDRIHKTLSCRRSWLPNQQRKRRDRRSLASLEIHNPNPVLKAGPSYCLWQNDWYNYLSLPKPTKKLSKLEVESV